MSYQTLKVTPDHGDPYVLEVTSRDALVWERTAKKVPNQGTVSIMGYLAYPSMVEAYRMAHIVAKREQRFTGSLKEFEEQHGLVIIGALDFDDPAPDNDEPDPTQPEASTDE